MLQLSREADYASRAVIHLAAQPDGTPALVNDISKEQEVPRNYLSKIMQRLAAAGLVKSRRGPKGGFTLARPAEDITLLEAIEAVEGPIHLNVCLIRKGECPRDATCPVHPVWKEAQRKLSEVLGGKTIAQLVKDAEEIKSRAEAL